MVACGRVFVAWVRHLCSEQDAAPNSEHEAVVQTVWDEERNDCIRVLNVMEIKLDEKLKKIIEDGDDVVIRKKKRDGKLVYIVYEQKLKIKAIIPCDEK